MKKYLLLMHENRNIMKSLSAEEMQKIIEDHITWGQKLEEMGYLVAGDGIEETGVLLEGKDCKIKHEPYVQDNNMIGGYYLLKGENIDDIINVAKECPCHLWGGKTEIRPVMDYEE